MSLVTFWAAKRAGVKVERVWIRASTKDFGVQNLGKRFIPLNAIPFGGFVHVWLESLGSYGCKKAKDICVILLINLYPSQAFIVSAGVLMNLLLAFVLLLRQVHFGQPFCNGRGFGMRLLKMEQLN